MKAHKWGSHTGNTWPDFPPLVIPHLKRGPTVGDKGLALVLRNLSPLMDSEEMQNTCAAVSPFCGAVSARAIWCSSLLQAKRMESQHACVSPGIVCQVYLAGSRSSYRSPCLGMVRICQQSKQKPRLLFPQHGCFHRTSRTPGLRQWPCRINTIISAIQC